MKKGEEDFDLIFMDVQTPILDGYEATKKLREKGVKTPIIACTAGSQENEKEIAISFGMNDILSKPFTKEGNGFFNTTINLDNDFTEFSYKIISEDGTKEKLYNTETLIFVKQVAVNYVRLTYEKETPIYNGKFAKTVDGKKYLNFEINIIKTN